MKLYISFKTKYKAKGKDDFEKNQYKCLRNLVCSKTVQNIKKQRHIELATDERTRNILASSVKF